MSSEQDGIRDPNLQLEDVIRPIEAGFILQKHAGPMNMVRAIFSLVFQDVPWQAPGSLDWLVHPDLPLFLDPSVPSHFPAGFSPPNPGIASNQSLERQAHGLSLLSVPGLFDADVSVPLTQHRALLTLIFVTPSISPASSSTISLPRGRSTVICLFLFVCDRDVTFIPAYEIFDLFDGP